MPRIDLDILNQKQTPAFYASSLATRPAAGFVGRIFIDSDSPSTGLYRDTGTAWIQIADPGAGTTGTLQQVTTNGNTTNKGISITAGGLTLGNSTGDNQTLLNLPASNTLIYRENVGSLYGFNIGAGDNSLFLTNTEGGFYQTLYFGDGVITNIFGISASNDLGVSWNPVLVVNQDNKVGINTNSPGVNLDVHGTTGVIAQFENTTTANTLISFRNQGAGIWSIGNNYNAGANDYIIYDATNFVNRFTIKSTGQTFIGNDTTSSGLLVVNSATSDNHIVCIGANAPSIRLRNTGTSPTLNVGLGISTATNNFIQGSASGQFCIFNASTTASPILFGVYDSGAGNTQEAARISAARNFLVGSVTDSGEKLQINGTGRFSGALSGTSATFLGSSGIVLRADVANGNNVTSNTKIAIGTNGQYGSISNKKYLDLDFIGYNNIPQARIRSWDENGSTGYGNLYFYTNSGTTDANILALQLSSTGEATFSNSIAIGNSVATGVVVASTHKVSILIGGVQYYLLASNV